MQYQGGDGNSVTSRSVLNETSLPHCGYIIMVCVSVCMFVYVHCMIEEEILDKNHNKCSLVKLHDRLFCPTALFL